MTRANMKQGATREWQNLVQIPNGLVHNRHLSSPDAQAGQDINQRGGGGESKKGRPRPGRRMPKKEPKKKKKD